ncbi:CHAP domain-containing protein [Nonomuraea sediminis]|uniref:CHAP domain-containing protein n=1 Tax=Nonomuraea sediminis TaxID=2835864 RepID=UPI001BDD6A11|nr:CHAP domain-containing protein [Nonomuraea sediminis]
MPGLDAMIKAASGEIAYRESGTNFTHYNRWLGKLPGYPHDGYGYPWCSSFLSWCLNASGNAGAGPKTAGCETGVAWFKARHRFYRTPEPGDFVYYGPGGGTHVELVVEVTRTSITTIGGNTSGSLDGRYFNGDGVYRKTVDRDSPRIYGYGRPDYPAAAPGKTPAPAKPKPERDNTTEAIVKKLPLLKQGDEGWHVKTMHYLLAARGYAVLPGVDDTQFTSSHVVALKHFQDGVGLPQTGTTTPDTWAALLKVA